MMVKNIQLKKKFQALPCGAIIVNINGVTNCSTYSIDKYLNDESLVYYKSCNCMFMLDF